jgi:serine-type D-Ala-D-Ala carboxypeptidase/endopeptidase (penicillin-binding protein 4)
MTAGAHEPRHLVPDAGRTTPRWRHWLLPGALALGALATGSTALALDEAATAASIDAGDPQAAVLSARRAPETLARPAEERRIAGALETWMAQFPSDSCTLVESPNATIFAHNETQPLAGASTQKLVTASALLLTYEPDARLETVAAASSAADAGTLEGDLFLIGGGDPLLATPDYIEELESQPFLADAGELAETIAASGIRHITGSVVGDESRYDAARFHPAWPERFRPQNVAGPVGALQINDGVMGFPKDGSLGSALTPPEDPAEYAAGVFTQLLEQHGVTVDGPARAGRAPDDVTTVATLPSAPLRDIAAQMLSASDNHTAEMLLKEIGHGEAGEGSWEAGAAAATDLLARGGFSLEGTQIVDGSGLSVENQITCRLLVDLLRRPDTGPMLLDGLAVAGESGTLADLGNDTTVAGRLRAKTGSVRTVSALAGQVSPLATEPLTFAYVATVPETQQIGDAGRTAWEALAGMLISGPDDAYLRALSPSGAPESDT